MRLSDVAILDILTRQQPAFLAGPLNTKTYAYIEYEHKIVNYLLSGNVSAAEHTLLYDAMFGMGCNGSVLYPRNVAILRTIQRSCATR